ncbi:hypothetical protein OROGR_026718 [Orobanche gracilis]
MEDETPEERDDGGESPEVRIQTESSRSERSRTTCILRFMTEMKETAFILQNASHRSLIVVDELGRATSSSDGFAIAWSCCEHLLALKGQHCSRALLDYALSGQAPSLNFIIIATVLQNKLYLLREFSPQELPIIFLLEITYQLITGFPSSVLEYTVFATHMENLSELTTIYPNVKIVHFDVEIKNKRMDFKFQLKDGPRHVAHYGLMLAEVAGLPSSVIESAKSITSKITQKEVKRIEMNYQQHHDIQVAYRVAQRLICLKYSNQDEDSIRQALQDLKESYINGGL